MSVLRLPVDGNDANFDVRFDLDGAEYRLGLRFNDRDQSWFFDMFDISGTLIRSGVKLVPNFPLNRQIADEIAPPGFLLLVDTRPDDERAPPNQSELGTEVLLTYVDESEL